MNDHPEFPQESPAIKYIVDQVSKVEEATNCSVGYYKSLAKIISRLDKTDVELNRLHQTTLDLKKVTDSDVVASVLGKKSDEMIKALHDNITITCIQLNKTTKTSLNDMRSDHSAILEIIGETDNRVNATIKRLDNHIKDVNSRIIQPLWKLWIYGALTLALGIIIGKWVV